MQFLFALLTRVVRTTSIWRPYKACSTASSIIGCNLQCVFYVYCWFFKSPDYM